MKERRKAQRGRGTRPKQSAGGLPTLAAKPRRPFAEDVSDESTARAPRSTDREQARLWYASAPGYRRRFVTRGVGHIGVSILAAGPPILQAAHRLVAAPLRLV